MYEDGKDFYVFVLAGQSNMVGRGTADKLDDALLDFVNMYADVYMAYDIDKSAKEQDNTTSDGEFLRLSRETQWSDGGKCYSHGPEWGIAQRFIERKFLRRSTDECVGDAMCSDSALERAKFEDAMLAEKQQYDAGTGNTCRHKIYFIKFAMGSTNLHEDWSPAGLYFPDFINFVQQMLSRVEAREGSSASIDGIFWNQGDSDASGRVEMRDNYGSNLLLLREPHPLRGFAAGCSIRRLATALES